MNYTETTL